MNYSYLGCKDEQQRFTQVQNMFVMYFKNFKTKKLAKCVRICCRVKGCEFQIWYKSKDQLDDTSGGKRSPVLLDISDDEYAFDMDEQDG